MPGLSGGVNGRVAVAAARLGKNNTTIRCLCEVNNERGEMIQCEVRLAPHKPATARISSCPHEFISVKDTTRGGHAHHALKSAPSQIPRFEAQLKQRAQVVAGSQLMFHTS